MEFCRLTGACCFAELLFCSLGVIPGGFNNKCALVLKEAGFLGFVIVPKARILISTNSTNSCEVDE
jgi:hypothetical protein